ncbi:MAG: TonB-dependent receptor [Paludibacter sp.]|nr:TonB-dependent receptor [Paludibacter sp.]
MKSKLKVTFIMLTVLSVQLIFAQSKSFNGRVLDEKKEPVVGATVIVKGTNNGVITDFDGNFKISALPDNQIVVSYIGYATQTIKVGAQTFLQIQLEPNVTALEDVVVIGYGTQKKVNLTGSVSTVDYSKQAMSRPITSTATALSGLSPGVQVMQGSGNPGSESVTINIRGVGTLNTSSPLVIVDGFESSISAVSPDDIETISVLKDAASCAIYGNRGANGVILITTKTGKGDKITVSYNGLFSYNQPSNLYKEVSNYADYMEFMNEAAVNVNSSPTFSQATIDLWREKQADPNGLSDSGYPNYVAYPNIDWMEALFTETWYKKHALTVSESSKKSNNLFSATYLDNPGIIQGTSSKKYQLRANITNNVTDWLQIGTKLWGYENDIDRNQLSNVFSYISRSSPGIYPYYDGKYGYLENSEESTTARNNLFFLNRTGGYYKNTYINASLFSTVSFPQNIKYNVSFNYNRYWSKQKYYVNTLSAYSFRRDEVAYSGYALENLNLQMSYEGNNRWVFQNNLSWNKKIANKHEISAMAGYESTYYNSDWTNASKTGLIDDAITELSTATEMTAITGTQQDEASQSIFGRATYAYDSRYLLEANLRYDGSSKFYQLSRWGLFPSFSAGWRISEETFMADANIDNLKIRASWGKLGNNSISNYAYQATYNTDYKYVFGGSTSNGIAQTTLSNNYLRWETTTSANVGIDLGILDNRLSAELEGYNRITDGILYRVPIYATLGNKTAPYQNLCEVTNKGAELTLTWQDKLGDFNYRVSVNGSRNYNQVSKYNGRLVEGWVDDGQGGRTYKSNIGDVTTKVDDFRRVLEGKIINEFYLLNVYTGNGTYFNADQTVNVAGGPKDGMIRTEEDMAWLQAMINAGYTFYPNQSIRKTGIWYGDYIYADKNEDGIYGNDYDKEFQNISLTPKIYYGLQASASWKGFDFSMNWAGAAGFAIYWRYLGLNSYSTQDGYSLPYDIAYDHYFYDPDNPTDPRTNLTSKNARLTKNYQNSQNEANSTLWLYRGDYLKLKNLTFGYTVPASLIKKIHLSDMRLFVSGENLFTITDFPGMDPEMQTATGYVTMKQYAFGINISF